MLTKDYETGAITCAECPLWRGRTDDQAATHLKREHPDHFALLTTMRVERNN